MTDVKAGPPKQSTAIVIPAGGAKPSLVTGLLRLAFLITGTMSVIMAFVVTNTDWGTDSVARVVSVIKGGFGFTVFALCLVGLAVLERDRR